jgi:hypothetical protein
MSKIVRRMSCVTLAACFVITMDGSRLAGASPPEDSARVMVAHDAQPNGVSVPPVPFLQVRARASGLRLVRRQLRDTNKRLGYTITARYPQIAGASDARARKFNRELAAMLMREMENFRKEFRGPKGRERRGAGDNALEVQYKVELANANLVSIWFGITKFFSGSAHESHESLVFNYDLDAGRKLRLGDLFKPDAPYLVVLSKYCIAAIRENIPGSDEEWIERGAATTEENYRNWNVNRTGLVIMFDQYQVASYAAGPQEITVPFAVLKDMLKPSGPLASISGIYGRSTRAGR